MTRKTRMDPQSDAGWIQRFEAARHESPASYLLANPGDVIVAEQLHCYPKASRKFPTWHQNGMLYTRQAMEQSSGEAAANFKSEAFHDWCTSLGFSTKTLTLIDLTGGIGMDSFAFSGFFGHVRHLEPDPDISQLARHNHKLLQAQNITHHNTTAEDFLVSLRSEVSHPQNFVFYADPSRRSEGNRVVRLSHCSPDITSILASLKELANSGKLSAPGIPFLLKVSPLYDLVQLAREIPELEKISVVSVSGEVREILAWVVIGPDSDPKVPNGSLHSKLDASGAKHEKFAKNHKLSENSTTSGIDNPPAGSIHSDNSTSARNLPVQAVCLPGGFRVSGEMQLNSGKNRAILANLSPGESPPPPAADELTGGGILHVPDPAIVKSGLLPVFASRFGLRRIGSEGNYLFSGKTVPGAQNYRILSTEPFKPKLLRRQFSGVSVNIHRSGFPLSPPEIYDRLGAIMGDDCHLFFTTRAGNERVVIKAEGPLQPEN